MNHCGCAKLAKDLESPAALFGRSERKVWLTALLKSFYYQTGLAHRKHRSEPCSGVYVCYRGEKHSHYFPPSAVAHSRRQKTAASREMGRVGRVIALIKFTPPPQVFTWGAPPPHFLRCTLQCNPSLFSSFLSLHLLHCAPL